MIGWLQGQLADRWQLGQRCGLLLVCHGVGYEVQITRRHWDGLPADGQNLTLHVHQTIRDDGWTLYGFGQRQERDLFRELVRAIVQADLRLLCQAPGVGKRTAERLSVELRSKLQERFGAGFAAGLPADDDLNGGSDAGATALAAPELREELQLTLTALGYEPLEINRALRAVAAQEPALAPDGEAWLRESLRWLSRTAA